MKKLHHIKNINFMFYMIMFNSTEKLQHIANNRTAKLSQTSNFKGKLISYFSSVSKIIYGNVGNNFQNASQIITLICFGLHQLSSYYNKYQI